jgi:hypothetical protein
MPELQPIVQRITTKYDPTGISAFIRQVEDIISTLPDAVKKITGLQTSAEKIAAEMDLSSHALDRFTISTEKTSDTLATLGRIGEKTGGLDLFANSVGELGISLGVSEEEALKLITATVQNSEVSKDAAVGTTLYANAIKDLGDKSGALTKKTITLKDVNKDLAGGLDKLSNKFLGVNISSLTAGAALVAFTGFMLACGKAADESDQIQRQLNATLETTGRISEVSASQLSHFADSLAGVSTFSNEKINEAYIAIAQFERVPTDKIDEVAIAAANMSAALGGDIVVNARTLAGILDTGLVPEGLKFTDVLRAQIQELIKAGETGAALNLILGEMDKKYGGQAALALESVSGMTKKLTNDWGDLMAAMGSSTSGPMFEAVKGIDNALVKIKELGAISDALSTQGGTHGKVSWWENLFPPAAFIHNISLKLIGYKDIVDGTADALYDQEEATKAVLEVQGDLSEEIVEATPKTRNWQETISALADKMHIGMMEAEDLARGINSIPKNTDITVTTHYLSTGDSASGSMGGGWPVDPRTGEPIKGENESNAQFEARHKAWVAGQGGGGGGGGTAAESAEDKWRAEHGYPPLKRAGGGKLGEGWNLVGEEGMELIDPSGLVYPNDETKRMLAKGLRNVTGFAEGSFIPRPPSTYGGWGGASGDRKGKNNGYPMPGNPKAGDEHGASGSDKNSGVGGSSGAELGAASSAAKQAGAAAGQAANAASSISKSIAVMSKSQDLTQMINIDQLEELKRINTNLEMWSSSIISEIQKAMS